MLGVAQATPVVDYQQLIEFIKSGRNADFKQALGTLTRREINLSGRSVLMGTAIGAGNASAVEAMLDWGMAVNRTLPFAYQGESYEVTPLLFAISAKARGGVIERLIARGADVNRDSEGLRPLNLALMTGQSAVANLLLDHGAQATYVEARSGITPLMELALAGDDAALARRLVDAGCPVNAQTSSGGTALALAVTAGNRPMVKVLLDLGANPNIRTGKGETALAIAQRRHKPELVDMLRQHGAQP